MKPTKSELLAYLREVKEVFAKQGKIENFHHFVQLLQDYPNAELNNSNLANSLSNGEDKGKIRKKAEGLPHKLVERLYALSCWSRLFAGLLLSSSAFYRAKQKYDFVWLGRMPSWTTATLRTSFRMVHMQGIAVGRAVDLTRFERYEDLLKKLEEMFDIEGELCRSTKKWQVVYTDDEDDIMMVGDDPCQVPLHADMERGSGP
ncbi:hypothetical protein C1H46_006965 [Malus baccata]|uniref:Auxin-responsive protein n=1 Tax=Malus baccata TaxID=106549 RepID=A0A540N8D0_MALBA|nr:hypothetical protein C1H46_006965 [Malus baccata]